MASTLSLVVPFFLFQRCCGLFCPVSDCFWGGGFGVSASHPLFG
jgi:hypothetical protein